MKKVSLVKTKLDAFKSFLCSLKEKNRLYGVLFIIFLTIGSFFWVLDIIIRGAESSQLSFFFLGLGDFFADFVNVVGYSAYGDPYNCMAYSGLEEKGYPPLTYVLLRPYSGLVDIDEYYKRDYFLDMVHEPAFMIMLILSLIVVMLALYLLFYRNINGAARFGAWTAVLLLLSKPVLYTVERGNILLLCLVFTAYYLLHYDDKDPIKKEAALLSLGIAFALKLSPAVLGILLLYNKQIREAVRAALYGMFFFIVPFFFIEGGLSNIPLMKRNMDLLIAKYTSGWKSLHEYFQLLHTFIPSDTVLKLVLYAICALLLVMCFFYRRGYEKVLSATLVLIMLPSVSHYYCVIYLIPSVIMFLNEKEHKRSDCIIFTVFVLLFALPVIPVLSDIPFQRWIMLLALLMLLRGAVDLAAWLGKKKNAGSDGKRTEI